MIVLYLIIVAFAIWLEWFIANQFAEVANAKGYYDTKYFWICFFLSWVGYLLVVALPDRGNTPQVISDELPEL